MRKNRILIVLLVIALLAIIGSRIWKNSKEYQYFQVAQEIMNGTDALKKVDESTELQSLTNITPYEIIGPNGESIYYYSCHTKYFNESDLDVNGVNTIVIDTIVDHDDVDYEEHTRVGAHPAYKYRIGERRYLVWTISAEYSFVLEYDNGSIDENDIMKIAESVQVPA